MARSPELEEAHATIARQAAELERLRGNEADVRFANNLRQALAQGAIASTAASTTSHAQLLEHIVSTATAVIQARAAALFLIDNEANELTFEVALGQQGEAVSQFRVPLGSGIAGLVALSGQPMAVSDVQNDPRHASEVASQIDYFPDSIACVPMLSGDDVIGVLECLDKQGGDAFTPDDMQMLGLFANQAALAIEQSLVSRNIGKTLLDIMAGAIGGAPDGQLERDAADFAARIEEDPMTARGIAVASLIHEIAGRGERDLALCEAILRSIIDHGRDGPGAVEELG